VPQRISRRITAIFGEKDNSMTQYLSFPAALVPGGAERVTIDFDALAAAQAERDKNTPPRVLNLSDLQPLLQHHDEIVRRLTAANELIEKYDPIVVDLKSQIASKIAARQVIEKTIKNSVADPVAQLALQSIDKKLVPLRDALAEWERKLETQQKISASTHKNLVEFDKENRATMDRLMKLDAAVDEGDGHRDRMRREVFPGDRRFNRSQTLEPENTDPLFQVDRHGGRD